MVSGQKKNMVIICLLLGCVIACTPSGSADWAAVKHVNDGDTILLSDDRRVRYIGIDTPEIDHEKKRAEAFGYEARDANRKLIATRKIRLEFDQEPHDRYGRLLAYVYLPDGTLVNAELLRLGLAVVLYKRPNTRLFDELLSAQREAMRAKLGLWKSLQGEGAAVVGNRNSLRFHRPPCQAVRHIRPSNKVAYQKKWDAYWDGFSPARDCIPREYK
jgi:endonuclease YncB( thermonuclease family)